MERRLMGHDLPVCVVVVVSACAVWIAAPVRGDFYSSGGFETPVEVKRPQRPLPTSRPDERRVNVEDVLYNEVTLSARQDAGSRWVWMIVAGAVVACVVVGAVYLVVFCPRGSPR